MLTRLPSNLKHDQPRMRAFSHSYFRSRKRDGGHAIRSAVGENPTLHAHFTAMCDPMTFIYELGQYCLEIGGMCKYELPKLSLSKVIADTHADMDTESTKIIDHATSLVVN